MEHGHFTLSFCVAILILSLFTATGAGADSDRYKNYIRLGIGVNQPTEDLDDAGYDADLFAGFVYGRYLVKNLVVEAGFNNFFADQELRGSSSFGNYTREDWIIVSSIVGTLKGELPLGPVVLFAGGGVGGYFVNFQSEIDFFSGGSFDEDEQDFVFGVHVVAGGYYNISPRFFIGAEGLYRWTDDVEIEENIFTIPVQLKGNLNGFAGTVLVGFRF
ncbi:MAG: hypothetical protein C4519_16275 [Desulfobacteraceae bacterium]|nr:MAG: hypothetical protein C4519_16275 [Desulfobacteraceae bacterium]